MAAQADKIVQMVRPSLQAMGLDVVQIRIVDGTKRKTLQVLAENPATGRITLDECAAASRTISALLDVEDAVVGAYNLEVSSPGIDRPLIALADFARYLGHEAKVETALPVGGDRRRFRGVLKAAEDNKVTITVDGSDYEIAHGNITQAKLVLTDALIKAYQQPANPITTA